MSSMSNVHVAYQFSDILEPMQESIKKYVQLNLYVNPDVENPLLKPYFKKIFVNKPDAEINISVQMGKNRMEKFDGVFMFHVDGKTIRYERTGTSSFRNPDDLVNHAFTHFKNEISDRGIIKKIKKRFS